jgi:DNA modification methylase
VEKMVREDTNQGLEYIFDWRYRLPYTDWEAIEKKRGFGYLKISKDCMEF